VTILFLYLKLLLYLAIFMFKIAHLP